MKLTIDSAENGVVRAQVSGRITQADVSPFLEPLGEAIGPDAYERKVMVDMNDVEVLDSSGVSWLLVCQKRFRQNGGMFVLHSMSDIAVNVLKVLNLQLVLKLADNAEDAQRMLEESSS